MTKGLSNISEDLLLQMYEGMQRIRKFEEKIIEVYPKQEMKCPVHLCIGQEAIAVGVCVNLKKDDYVFSNHRSHGHCIAKGMDLKVLMAELYGKEVGCSKGKGGSMHLVDSECGILGTSSIVGGGLAIALGTALASVMKNDDKVTVAFFGDGAVDTGTFHESLNFAALKKLPIVFICENNLYATFSHISARQSKDNIYKKADSYGIPGFRIDGNDALKVFKASGEAIKRARKKDGPTLIECRTYRWMSHVGIQSDIDLGYRTKKELEEWMAKCPIKRFKKYLLDSDNTYKEKLDKIDKKLSQEIEKAHSFGLKSQYTDGNKELLKDVYNDALD